MKKQVFSSCLMFVPGGCCLAASEALPADN